MADGELSVVEVILSLIGKHIVARRVNGITALD